jgi:hypothetical protein
MPNGRRALATAGFVALVHVAASAAGPPGTWSRAGKRPGSDAYFAGIARTADGVLHVVSPRENGSKTDLWQVRLGSDGRVLGSNPVVLGWSELGNPDLALTADGGVRAVFGGAHSGDPGDPSTGLLTATAPERGGPWTLQQSPVVPDAGLATAEVATTAARDGTAVVAWTTADGLRYRYGVEPSGHTAAVPAAGCCGSDPAVAVESGGLAYVAWASADIGSSGVVVQAIAPSGPLGRALYAPGSAAKHRVAAVPPGQRVALAARSGAAGVVLAYVVGYPKARGVAFWLVGAPAATFRLPAKGATDVALAAAPQGRLWLAWQQGGKLFATRTNRAATRVEPVRSFTPPPRTTAIWSVQGEASLGPLDLVTNLDATGGTTFWHQQILPLLSLRITATGQADGTVRYAFTVTDAGDPVPNATVRFGAQTLTTGISGTVVLTTSDHPLAASASKPGYATGSAPVPSP